jgi:hypothetical protein
VPSSGRTSRQSRREVDHFVAALRGHDLRAQHIGVAKVGHRVRDRVHRLEGERAAALLVEQPREDRRRVESREAEPVDAGIRADERKDPPVADGAVVELHALIISWR